MLTDTNALLLMRDSCIIKWKMTGFSPQGNCHRIPLLLGKWNNSVLERARALWEGSGTDRGSRDLTHGEPLDVYCEIILLYASLYFCYFLPMHECNNTTVTTLLIFLSPWAGKALGCWGGIVMRFENRIKNHWIIQS